MDTGWFLAVITALCDKEEIDCANIPCSWQQYQFCDNLSTVDQTKPLNLIYGDCTNDENVAYPIKQGYIPNIGDIVLMRYRGAYDLQNIFEFLATGNSISSNTLSLTAVQCTGGNFIATYSEGCQEQ